LLDGPQLCSGCRERLAGELLDPIALRGIDGVAEPRRFAVAHRTHARDLARR